MKNVIEIRGLTKRYDGFTLDHVNLDVPGGTIMGLIGENGAGKSTLIKGLLGLIRCEGECRILGQSLNDGLKNDIGVVLDESMFHDVLNPAQIGKILSGVFSNWDSRLYADYLEKFQLPPKKLHKEFSRGMKMKLSIAAALAHHPKVLILDEATGGLDPVVRNEILDEFTSFVSDEEHGILISSHITSDLERAADYVTYLHCGTVFLSGEKDELLRSYGRLVCSSSDLALLPKEELLGLRQGKFGCEALVKDRQAFERRYAGLLIEPVSLEDIMVFTGRGERV
jgi:ABC-type multidrug transport system, ATPase component